MCRIWESYDASAAVSVEADGSSSVHVFTLLIYSLKLLMTTSRPILFSISTQMQDVGVSANETLPYSDSHSWGRVKGMLATAVQRYSYCVNWDGIYIRRNFLKVVTSG